MRARLLESLCHLAHEDPLRPSGVDGFQSGHIRSASIDGHFFGCAVLLDRLCEEPACRGLITSARTAACDVDLAGRRQVGVLVA